MQKCILIKITNETFSNRNGVADSQLLNLIDSKIEESKIKGGGDL